MTDSLPDISVLIPVTERHDDLRSLCDEVRKALDPVTRNIELLVLVTYPFDEALETVREIAALDPRVRLLHFARSADEANVLSVGFSRASGRVFMTVPSYFDADLAALPELYEEVQAGADLVIGRRVKRTNGVLKRIQSTWFNVLGRWATGTQFQDLASGTRALRREVAEEIRLYGDFHRFLPVLADRVGLSVVEVEVPQDPRYSAPPLYSMRTYVWRSIDLLSIFFLSRFTRRPLRLFGAVGGLFGLSGLVLLATLAVQRLGGTPLADRPLLVLGALLIGVGVQVLTIGLLGELILFFHAREVRDYRVEEVLEAEFAGAASAEAAVLETPAVAIAGESQTEQATEDHH